MKRRRNLVETCQVLCINSTNNDDIMLALRAIFTGNPAGKLSWNSGFNRYPLNIIIGGIGLPSAFAQAATVSFSTYSGAIIRTHSLLCANTIGCL